MKVYEMMSELGKLPAGDEIAIPPSFGAAGRVRAR